MNDLWRIKYNCGLLTKFYHMQTDMGQELIEKKSLSFFLLYDSGFSVKRQKKMHQTALCEHRLKGKLFF